ncbi:hypothetical protein FGF1_36120 [Flavobacteriaceae bacterium GF1]
MHRNRVLFIAPRFHTNQYFLTKQLIQKNVEVSFLSIYVGGSENHKYVTPIISEPSLITKFTLRDKNVVNAKDREIISKYHLTSFSHCRKIYRDSSPDAVIIRNLRNLISIQHMIISLLLGKKIYLYTQNKYKENISSKRKFLYRLFGVAGIQQITPVYGEEIDAIVPNTLYTPFVINKLVTKISVRNKGKTPGIKLITIGKMQERKNIIELIDSLIRINFFGSESNSLVIVSECISVQNYQYLDRIKEKIKLFESQVSLKLNIKHNEVFSLLKSSDLFILPSHAEPAAFSILEAMACGLAVVSSNRNGTKCYIKDGVNGRIFRYSKDFGDLDNVLSEMLDKNTLMEYGLGSLKLIEDNHGIDSFYKQVVIGQLK